MAVLRLDPTPRPAALAAALDRLQERHPLLRSRVERRGRRESFRLDPAVGRIPLSRVERDGDQRWIEIAEAELDHALEDRRGPLARCVLVAPAGGDGEGEIVVTVAHAVIDATGFVILCRQLLELCGEPAGDGEPAATELPPRADDRFPEALRGRRRWMPMASFLRRQIAREAAFRWRTRHDRKPAVAATAKCRIHLVALSRAATAALGRRTRGERLTLTSVLNAALLLAVRKHLYGGQARALRYFTFPDLRGYLRPRVPRDAVASYMTVMRLEALIDGDSLWPLARQIHRDLARALSRDDKLLSAYFAPLMMRAFIRLGRQRMGAVALSYTGETGLEGRHGSLRLTSLHAFVSNFPIGPEYTAQVRLFAGRLLWDIVYLEPEMEPATARRIAEEIHGYLESAATSEPT